MADDNEGLMDGDPSQTAPTTAPAADAADHKADPESELFDGEEPENPETQIETGDEQVPAGTESTDENAGAEQGAGNQDEQSKFNPDLIERALKAGLSEEDMTEFDNEKSLRQAVKIAERTGSTPKIPTKTKDGNTEATQASDEEYKLDLTAEELEAMDPAVAKAVQGMVGEINRLRGTVTNLNAQSSQREFKEFQGWFDSQLEGLSKEYEALFGKGKRDQVDEKSEQFQNRDKLWRAMGTIVAGLSQRKEKIPAREELFKQALNMVFADKATEIERARIGAAVAKRGKNFISRPTSRESKSLKDPMKRTFEKVGAKMAEIGLHPDPEDESDMEAF